MGETLLQENLQLTDLFHVELLQELQDSFYDLTGLSMGISDPEGNPITRHKACHDFCLKYTKGSELGGKRCRECDVRAARISAERGEPIIYTCHNGLMDFASPIMVGGKLLGCFLGGQVMEHIIDESKIRERALEFGIDPDEYVHAAKRIPMMDRGHLARLARFFSTISNMMSHMAYKRYYTQQMSTEIEREANMKSDFLANMSHEIRTPMNAVIGMAEMALREELPPPARQYINQIKTAGNSLLTIINDILDFSKIESGKMDINLVQYEPISLVNDVSSIIMTRIGDKDLELLVDFDPDIPLQLMGDSSRIKQIIVNLANNAVKFTKEGRVELKVAFARTSEHEVLLTVTVSDTGIGIKKEDLGKLFQSFSQVDSKRNRNIEGTGLGLAISKQLVSLMNGRIWVESEYNKGSTFGFEIPQIMLSDGVSVQLKEPRAIKAGILSGNQYVESGLIRDLERFGVETVKVLGTDLEREIEGAEFFFIDYPSFNDKVQEYVRQHPELTAVVMTAFQTSVSYAESNIRVVKKPLFALNIGAILNDDDLFRDCGPQEGEEFDFIAPEAKVLIVDDNELNLTVAKGLMDPLQMEVDTALSGREAIEKIADKHYDLIFMDHMMPELDGVETTHIIRETHEEYNMVPIIALTANVVEEMRSMFLVEGMNDYLAKPIEIGLMVSKIRQWLPQEKIQPLDEKTLAEMAQKRAAQEEQESGRSLDALRSTGELDIDTALKLLGSEKLLWDVLDDYYKVIARKADLIQKYYEAEDWPNYAIEVHALKSASKQIGAMELSETAAKLEAASKEEDVKTIVGAHDSMLATYRCYEDVLRPFMEDTQKVSEEGLEPADPQTLRDCFAKLREYMDDLDMDGMEEVAGELGHYSYPPEQKEIYQKLCEGVEDLDIDACIEYVDQWEALIG